MSAANVRQQASAAVTDFIDRTRSAVVQGLSVEVSEPADDDGVWFIDFSLAACDVVAQYSPSLGSGLSLNDHSFDNAPRERFADGESAALRAAELLRS